VTSSDLDPVDPVDQALEELAWTDYRRMMNSALPTTRRARLAPLEMWMSDHMMKWSAPAHAATARLGLAKCSRSYLYQIRTGLAATAPGFIGAMCAVMQVDPATTTRLLEQAGERQPLQASAPASALALAHAIATCGRWPSMEEPSMLEQWRPVLGFEGYYEVSDHGSIRRVKSGHGVKPYAPVRLRLSRNGYVRVSLYRDRSPSYHGVHRLVAMAFIGQPLDGQVVNHNDGNKTNNTVANLEWATQSANLRHAYAMGLKTGSDMRGVRNGRAKLTPAQVAEIRALKGAERHIDVARRYGVSKATIHYIQSGKHWKDAEWPEALRVREWPVLDQKWTGA
jgi:hypothetical protein